MRGSVLLVGLLASAAACESSSGGDATTGSGGAPTGTGGQSAPSTGGSSGGVPVTGGTTGGAKTGGAPSGTGGAALGGTSSTGGAAPSGGTSAGGTSNGGTAGEAGGSGGLATGGGPAGGSGGGVQGGGAGQAGAKSSGGSGGGVPNNCVGKAWTTADPTKAGPFQVGTDKNVGPLAGVVPDPIYGDKQQRFNVYRPNNLADTGYCHPILIWANGFKDNPEQNPPDCIVNQSDRWCGQYSPLLKHLASHGFVVVASLSTATAEGDPLPTIAGLDWILEQSEDSSSPYYHHLDTANIGQLGHSYGGMSTCMSASEPRYKALATICGTRALMGVHTPMLFFCGGKDGTVKCDGVKTVFQSVTNQPAFFLNELNSDHGSWVYQGAGGVSLSSAAAWFRVHLMNDTANRKYFYGANCTFCTDNRVEAAQNSLMAQ
jgi:hypothetical protein